MMTQDHFIAALSIPGFSRVGRRIRSRIVVHSLCGNSSFKAYYAGDYWIVGTWQPAAFLFSLPKCEVAAVTKGLLSRAMHSQFEYIQQSHPSAAQLSDYTIEIAGLPCSEGILRQRLYEAAECITSVDAGISDPILTFEGGIRVHIEGHVIVLFFLGEPTEPVRNDDCLCYGTLGALGSPQIRKLLIDAGIVLKCDDDNNETDGQ